MNRDQFWLTDEQFSKIVPHLPTDTRGKPRTDDLRVISGIVHVLKSGGRWVDAPPEYGPRKTLYNRYVRWAAKGVWVDLFHALAPNIFVTCAPDRRHRTNQDAGTSAERITDPPGLEHFFLEQNLQTGGGDFAAPTRDV